MNQRLQKAGLCSADESTPDINISLAWSLLSRIGLPGRYGGRSQDGSYEFVITDPDSGDFLASGRGTTLELSICEAVINATTRSQQQPSATSMAYQ